MAHRLARLRPAGPRAREGFRTTRCTLVLAAGATPSLRSLVALEELCAMNIRFDAQNNVLPQHRPLDELALLVMQNY